MKPSETFSLNEITSKDYVLLWNNIITVTFNITKYKELKKNSLC